MKNHLSFFPLVALSFVCLTCFFDRHFLSKPVFAAEKAEDTKPGIVTFNFKDGYTLTVKHVGTTTHETTKHYNKCEKLVVVQYSPDLGEAQYARIEDVSETDAKRIRVYVLHVTFKPPGSKILRVRSWPLSVFMNENARVPKDEPKDTKLLFPDGIEVDMWPQVKK